MSQALGQLLLDRGVVDEVGLASAQQEARDGGSSLGRALLNLRLVTEFQIVQTIATQLGLPFADTRPGAVDPEVARMLPRSVAMELMALPVEITDSGSLVVAVADSDSSVIERVSRETGLPCEAALAVRADLEQAIANLTDDAHAPARDTLAGVATRRPAQPSTQGEQGPLLEFEQELSLDLNAVLREMLARQASDLHLTAGLPAMIRVHGEIEPLPDQPVLSATDLRKAIYSILTQKQREQFENELELDLSYQVPGAARFRVNVFQQRDAIGAVMRVIPFEIKTIEELGVPAQVTNFAHLRRGFVLVTGPTGSGKSTTLAGLIDVINRERAAHIMTVEDPIEFLHQHKRSVVNQRELHTDTHSFAQALKHVVRQDPDVILVGEMRDLETIQVALTAAETGHLVFGTLHTQDAPQTIDRVIDVFPPHQQEQIRVMLSGALQGVVCQQLLKKSDGSGRVVACEVMVATPAIKNLIREGKTHQMYSSLQAGKQYGMVTMDQSLAHLVIAGKVSYHEALEKCNNIPDFNRLCGRA